MSYTKVEYESVDGEDVALEAGDALRVSADSARQIHNGDAESRFVLIGSSGAE